MGLDKTAAEVLCAARSLGADFANSVMIGRQWLTAPETTLNLIAKLQGKTTSQSPFSKYAEPFFELLGAETVDSVDVSGFEGASLTHDMNNPLPAHFSERFSLVFDGGTLEHIFNAPQAFKNCMQMLRPGGFFVQVSPGNNFMGHGFWQFSPELLYRLFSESNGFSTMGVLVQELPHLWRETRQGKYYFARDPAALGWRVELRNVWPTYVAVIAKKIAAVEPLKQWPQQSDYVKLWDGGEPAELTSSTSLKSILRRAIPAGLERALRPPLRNKAYVFVENDDLLRGRLPSQSRESPGNF